MTYSPPPSDWYPSPSVPGRLQYWNGFSWTDDYKPDESLKVNKAKPDSITPKRRGNGSGKPKLDIPIAMIIMGAMFFTYVLTMMTPTFIELSANRTSVEGQVSELVYSTSYRKKAQAKTILCSRVAYYSVDGEDYWVNSTIKRKSCPWEVGQPVKVSYESGSPGEKEIVLDDATINLKVNIIVGSASLASLAGGIVLFVNRLKRRRIYMSRLNI